MLLKYQNKLHFLKLPEWSYKAYNHNLHKAKSIFNSENNLMLNVWDSSEAFPRGLGHFLASLLTAYSLPFRFQAATFHWRWCFWWLSLGIQTARVPCHTLASLSYSPWSLHVFKTNTIWVTLTLQSLASSKECCCIWMHGGTASIPY